MTTTVRAAERRHLRRSLGRLVGGWPIWLHRIGLGRLVGRRYAVVASTGRRTGLARRAAVMVLHENRTTGEIFVVAGDRETNWYRNVCDSPATEVWLAGRHFRPLQRLLSTGEIIELLTAIRRDRPREARIQSAFFGWPWPATRAQLGSLAASLGGVVFRPQSAGDAASRAPRRPRRAPEVLFLEEYPTAASLERARLIPFAATVFLATETWPEFARARSRLKEKNPRLAAAWWPVPVTSRALSVFCEPAEVAALTEALRLAPTGRVLLDLELPVWAPRRLLRLPWSLRTSGHELDRLFGVARGRHEVWTAEWPPAAPGRILRSLGLVLPGANHRVYMLYRSTLPGWWRRLLLGRLKPRFGSQAAAIGVGVLATGIAGDEPLLSLAQFEESLDEAVRLGAAAIVIYRLGGLEPRHVRVIEELLGPRQSAPLQAA